MKLFFICILLLLSGCGSPDSDGSSAQDPSLPPRTTVTEFLLPSADGTDVYGNDFVSIDASNTSEGYVMVRYTGPADKSRLQMTAPDGTTPTKPQVHRLTAGFALGALLFTAPMAALNSVLIPQTISRLSGTDRVTDLALLSVVGTLLTFLMNAWISVGSDHSYCPLGRRTPWIIVGTVLTATSVAILSACDFMPLVIVFWLFTLIGHAMVSMPLAAAFGERVPDKFRDRADAWRGVGQAFGQVLGIIAAVSITWAADDSGWDGTTRFAMMVFALCLVMAGVATLLVLPFEGSSSYLPREGVKKGDYFSQYRPPKGAPKFFIAFAARMFAIAATSGIAIYQWYLAQDGLGDASQVTMFGLSGAAAVMSMMAVAAFVGSLLAALLLGRIARAFKDSRIPAIAACLLFVVAVVLPLTPIDSAMAVALYALFAGFAYVVYDGVSQGLNLATLPDVRSVGRSLAAFSLANTFGSLIGAVVCAIAIAVTGEYLLIFAVAAGCMAVAGVLTLLLK